MRRLTLAALATLAVATLAPAARAQTFETDADIVDGHRYRSAQRFAFELRFGPYRPDVDGEFDGARHPYQDFFGSGNHLMTQIEVDYEIYHRFGTIAVGTGVGYFSVTGTSPVANGTGLPSGDHSTMKVIPVSFSAVYRFDYFQERRNIPLVPYGKAGLDWAYWQITDGNDEIATDGHGGTGRGGTLGWHAAVGVGLVLDWLDPEAARDFDNEMGVNHTSLVFQLTHADISGLGASGRMHVGDTNWSLGLMFQF
ncbi:MAG TPA: MXAN_2562 family outer membrane beta-barrel protein [Polyangia bacterium]|nr:MXAN_2562 family outer membrane beta-barrel protein [Polyangia bacterium]